MYVYAEARTMLFSLYQREKTESSQKCVFQLGKVILRMVSTITKKWRFSPYHGNCYVANIGQEPKYEGE